MRRDSRESFWGIGIVPAIDALALVMLGLYTLITDWNNKVPLLLFSGFATPHLLLAIFLRNPTPRIIGSAICVGGITATVIGLPVLMLWHEFMRERHGLLITVPLLLWTAVHVVWVARLFVLQRALGGMPIHHGFEVILPREDN